MSTVKNKTTFLRICLSYYSDFHLRDNDAFSFGTTVLKLAHNQADINRKNNVAIESESESESNLLWAITRASLFACICLPFTKLALLKVC